jgi:hypothetical protein
MQVGKDLLGAVKMWATVMSIVIITAIVAHWLFAPLQDTRWSTILPALLNGAQRFFSIHGLS